MKDLRLLAVWVMLGCVATPGGGAVSARPVRAAVQRGAVPRPMPVKESELHHPMLWHDPGAIAQLDLLHGPGGREQMPDPPFTFQQEEPTRSSPKIDVQDGTARRWRLEPGRDARAEVAASRLLWAVGYLTDDDYVLWKASVRDLKMRNARRYLHTDRKRRRGVRGPYEIAGAPESYFLDVRFARLYDGQRNLGYWSWRKNQFSGTQEMNGLRVMMALLNCWDLRDENNEVVADPRSSSELFRVSGVGASFGNAGPHFLRGHSRDNVKAYARSKFITRKTESTVDFATPSRSYNPFSLFHRRSGTTWIGRNIPRKDARWIASLLAQLSHTQIEEAFWAAGYSASEVNLYADVVDARIRALSDL